MSMLVGSLWEAAYVHQGQCEAFHSVPVAGESVVQGKVGSLQVQLF